MAKEELIKEEATETKEAKEKTEKKKKNRKEKDSAKKEKIAKKAGKKAAKNGIQPFEEGVLPQNVFQMGDNVEESKNIYIWQKVYKEIHKFTKNKTTNESGGVLVGSIIEEFGKTNIIITGFVEAKYCEATPTALTFTHDTWEYIHSEIDKKHYDKKIVGWIHTHPDFGIFLSEYDKFIQENFFNEDYQVAYVVDPIQKIEGFYFWINSNLEKCKGFYVFDKNGTNISVSNWIEEDEPVAEKPSLFKNILLGILSFIVVIQFFWLYSINSELTQIKENENKFRNSISRLDSFATVINQLFELGIYDSGPATDAFGYPGYEFYFKDPATHSNDSMDETDDSTANGNQDNSNINQNDQQSGNDEQSPPQNNNSTGMQNSPSEGDSSPDNENLPSSDSNGSTITEGAE